MASRSRRLWAWKAIRVRVSVTPAIWAMPRLTTVGELIVLTDADHGDDVGVAGHGVHLGDAVDLGQLDGQVGDPCRLCVDEDEGVHHASRGYRAGTFVARRARARRRPSGSWAGARESHARAGRS